MSIGAYNNTAAQRTEQLVSFDDGGYVYMLASAKHGVLYVGVTSRLAQRIYEHREHVTGGFTAKYAVNRLVWYQQHGTIEDAIQREKQIKHWKREWKINRIEMCNPHWADLAIGLFGYAPLAPTS